MDEAHDRKDVALMDCLPVAVNKRSADCIVSNWIYMLSQPAILHEIPLESLSEISGSHLFPKIFQKRPKPGQILDIPANKHFTLVGILPSNHK